MTFTFFLRSIYHRLPIKLSWLRNLYFTIRNAQDKNKIVVKRIDGINYELHLNEFIDSAIYHYGCFEEDTTKAIKKMVRPGMTVLDIGANIGAHVLPMAKLVGPQGKVIAFEPMTWARKKLSRNLALNEFDNIVIEPLALSNKHEVKLASFRTSWDRFDNTGQTNEKAEELCFETLDNYAQKNNLQHIDFIKLDVDGFEYKILQGAVSLLKKFKPILCLELGNWTLEKQGDSLEALINLLYGLGYNLFKESDFTLLGDYDAIMREFPNPKTWTINVIAINNTETHQF